MRQQLHRDGLTTATSRLRRCWQIMTPSSLLLVAPVLLLVLNNIVGTTLAFAPPTRVASRIGRHGSLLRESPPAFDVIANAPDITFDNFWIQTVANYTECDKPDRPPDFSSKGGSMYWNEDKGVIRCSDHWSGQLGCGMIKDCYWSIDVHQVKKNQFLTGRCDFATFVKAKKRSMKKWSVRNKNLTLSRLSILQLQPLQDGADVDDTNVIPN